MSGAPAIRVRHLSHRYGARAVLRDVSFDVPHGEIFGFIGPSGAGKTTTIRVMATLLHAPPSGRHQTWSALMPSGSVACTRTVTGSNGPGTAGMCCSPA